MKKVISNPIFWIGLVLAAVVIYIVVKDSGVKIATTPKPATLPAVAPTATVAVV